MKKLLFTLITIFSITAHAQHFKTGSHVATGELKEELAKFYDDKVKDKKVHSLIVEGHTDIRGGEVYNQKLSERRAKTALTELKLLGFKVKDVDVKVKGLGESLPVSNNHAQNRRIVLKIKSDAGSSIVVIKACKDKEVIKKVYIKPKKNRIRLLGGKGPTGVELDKNQHSATIKEDKGLVLGLGYDRLITDKISVGAQVQTNETLLLSIGLDF